MNILITSGGTIEPIDDVRHIANFSSGELLSLIAEEALKEGHTVLYLHAKNTKKPFSSSCALNPLQPARPQFAEFLKFQQFFKKAHRQLSLIEYKTFDDYRRELKQLISGNPVDIAFLGAAVSDFGTTPHRGKLSSSKEFVIRLSRNQKIIGFVKQWSKKSLFQVGFKLLSDVSEKELIETAYASGLANRSDLTIANDLQAIRAGSRTVFAVTQEKGAVKMENPGLAQKILSFAVRRAAVHHFRTIHTSDERFSKQYLLQRREIKHACAHFSRNGLMPPFHEDDPRRGHGSIALRIDDGFLITARGSNKAALGRDDIVHVRSVDWKKRIIHSRSNGNKKASFNAVLVQKIFDTLPSTSVVVHTHSFAKKSQATEFPETPGTSEYIASIMPLLKKQRIANLTHHGLVCIGDDLSETIHYVSKKM